MKKTVKVALCYDETETICPWEIHKYTLLFRLFGPRVSCSFIACGSSRDGAIKNAEDRVFKRLKIIEILTLKRGQRREHEDH
jgi:hypothetical protein